jgi:hypothetical protein
MSWSTLSRFAAALLLCVLELQPVKAQEFRSSISSHELLQRCRPAILVLNGVRQAATLDALARATYCAGFVEAAADAGAFLGALNAPLRPSRSANTQRSIRNCAGPEVSGEALLGIVVQFLLDHPNSGEQSAATATMLAIARAFPCEASI